MSEYHYVSCHADSIVLGFCFIVRFFDDPLVCGYQGSN